MKKLLILFVTLALLLCIPFTAFATSEETIPEETGAATPESSAESENGGDSAVSEPSSAENVPITDKIISFIIEHYGDSAIISFAVTMVVGIVIFLKRNKGLLAAIGVFNKNAITFAKNSDDSLRTASNTMERMERKLSESVSKMEALMDRIQKSEDEKSALETVVKNDAERFERFKMAVIELGNEIAQLLNISNIPTSVKDDFYARHKEVLAMIDGKSTEEVSEDVGEKA